MFTFHTLILVIHISAAAMLIGGGLGISRNLKKAVAIGGATFSLAAEDAMRRGGVLGMCSLLTILTGVGLIFRIGGFAAAPLNFHIALGLMLIGFVVSSTVMRPGLNAVVAQSKNPTPDAAAIQAGLKKMAAAQGILHLLWVVVLCLMLVRIYR